MYILQKLEYKQEGKELKHIGTRVIKTFSERKQAEEYLENCLKLNMYINTKEQYKLEKI